MTILALFERLNMLIKCLFVFFSWLPIRLSQAVATIVGVFFYHFDNKEKSTAKINIDLCFSHWSEQKKQTLLKATLRENAKTLLETPKIYRKGGNYAIRLVSEVSGLTHYHQAIASGQGVILLAPHLGNWEVVVHYLNQFSPITAMYAPPKQVFLDALMKKGRQSSGAVLVPADLSGVRAQLKQLKQGGVIGVLPDQKPKAGHAGIFAPFMGQPAYTMLLVNHLMKRTAAIPLMTFAQRLPAGQGYHLHIRPAFSGLGADDEYMAATALNDSIADCVQLAAAQYQWTYRRFSLQPNKQTPPY